MWMFFKFKSIFLILATAFLITSTDVSGGEPCVVPDNGSGTITLPPAGCDFTSPDEKFMIIDGLPPGTTIEMEGILMDFICCNSGCPLCTLSLPPGQCEMAA